MGKEARMADPRLEQERILPRLQRILDVVSSWADPAPDARAPNLDDLETTGAADAASGPAAGASPALPASADRDGDADTDRTHGSASGTGRRHARATEPIWHLLAGQDASLPTALPRAPGPGLGDPARAASMAPAASHPPAPGTHAAAFAGESVATAAGIDPLSGTSRARPAAGSVAVTAESDPSSDSSGAWPIAGAATAASDMDAAVLQPLLGQETPPLFGRAVAPGRTPTGSNTSVPAAQPSAPGASGASGASGSSPGPTLAPWRATAHAVEPGPVSGHTSSIARAGAAPGSLLHPPDLLGAGERGSAWPEPRSGALVERALPADLQPPGPGAPLAQPPSMDTASAVDHAVGRAADHAFGHSELEDELADVLERAALEAGVDLS
jgi:hypothetical protein